MNRPESIPVSAEKAQELLDNMQMREFTNLSDEERWWITENVWDKMPGYTCFHNAVCRIAKNEVEDE